MRVLSTEDLVSEASARALPWTALDDAFAWREALRAHVAAAGILLRRSLLDRVLRWHGLSLDDPEARVRVNELLEDLDAVGDVLLGDGGLVAAAPVRAARVRGSSTVLLLGSVTTEALREALPDEVIERRRVRRAVLTRHDGEALSGAMEVLGGRVTDADAWAGLDRAPPTLDAWWDALATLRATEEMAPWGDEPEVLVVREGRSRWRPEREAGEVLPLLERQRQPGGWYRFAWRREDARVSLTTDEASRAALAVEARAGAPRTVVAMGAPDGSVVCTVPARLPRAEYRLLLGTAHRIEGEKGARYAVPWDVWATIAGVLRERLGLVVDEAGVTT